VANLSHATGLPAASVVAGALANGMTATTQTPISDNTQAVATDAFVQYAIDASMATVALTGITGGTYSYASLGSGAVFSYTVASPPGPITSIGTIFGGGTNYKVGDLVTSAKGNGDAVLEVTTVTGTACGGTACTVGSLAILYGGSGYSSGVNVATSSATTLPYTFEVSGTLTSNANFIMPNGTLLAASNQWVFVNNTTGAHSVTVYISNGSNATTGNGVVIPQGSSNSVGIQVFTDGSTDIWPITPGTSHTLTSIQTCPDSSTSATTYVCGTSPTFTPVAGDEVIFTNINQNNSGASTLNVNGLGAKAITKQQNAAALASGDLQASGIVVVVYDGTNWEIQGQIGNSGGGSANAVTAGSAAAAANQTCVASGASRTCSYIDFPDVQTHAAGIWNGTSNNLMWNVDGSQCIPNTLGVTYSYGAIQCITGVNYAFFTVALPEDWDTASQPYVALLSASSIVNPSKTVIWTPSVSCSSNGVAIADATYHAESAYSTINTPTSGAILTQRSSARLTQATSGNGCVPGGYMNIRFVLSGTTTASDYIIAAVVTIPRLLVVQAN
jgi:hypothetical protein